MNHPLIAPVQDKLHTVRFALDSTDSRRLINLCGQFDQHLRLLESRIKVEINNRGHQFNVTGSKADVDITRQLIDKLYEATADELLTPEHVHLFLQEASLLETKETSKPVKTIEVKTPRRTVKTRGLRQTQYIEAIRDYDLNFGIGAAGTGKTYLAVASAVEALMNDQVRRLVLVRPAVEAGERLGFLPGDLSQKIDPYLRPIYDALYEMLGFEKVNKLIENNTIEVAPLAYMRGRTLNNAFIIMDEAQNTTCEQMKMFLTRLGFGSTAVITGDITQVDLPRHQQSGLRHVLNLLKPVDDISFTWFESEDVVRHPLVKRIIDVYNENETQQTQNRSNR